MPKFPSPILCFITYVFAFALYAGCDNPPRSVPATPPSVKQSIAVSAELPTEPKTEEVIVLDTTVITGHTTVGDDSVLGVVSDDTEHAACKMAGDFLVVPLLSDMSTFVTCGDQLVYVMKLVNCTKEKILFTKFDFTITSALNQGEGVEVGLANEFVQFELHIDNDQSSYISMFKPVDERSGTVPFAEATIEVEAGEERSCRLKVNRRCSGAGDLLEFNLDLTGALASKVDEGGKYANGAVFNKPDRQVTFMSRD